MATNSVDRVVRRMVISKGRNIRTYQPAMSIRDSLVLTCMLDWCSARGGPVDSKPHLTLRFYVNGYAMGDD